MKPWGTKPLALISKRVIGWRWWLARVAKYLPLPLCRTFEQTLENRSDSRFNQLYCSSSSCRHGGETHHPESMKLQMDHGNLKEWGADEREVKIGKGYFPPRPIRKLWQPPIKMSPAQFPWLPKFQLSSSSRPPSVPQLVSIVSWQEGNVCPNIGGCPKSCNHLQPFVSLTPPLTLPPTFAPNPPSEVYWKCTYRSYAHIKWSSTCSLLIVATHVLYLQMATKNDRHHDRANIWG